MGIKLRGNKWAGPFKILHVRDYNVELDIQNKHKSINKSRIKPAEKARSKYGRIYKPVDRLGVE